MDIWLHQPICSRGHRQDMPRLKGQNIVIELNAIKNSSISTQVRIGWPILNNQRRNFCSNGFTLLFFLGCQLLFVHPNLWCSLIFVASLCYTNQQTMILHCSYLKELEENKIVVWALLSAICVNKKITLGNETEVIEWALNLSKEISA